MFHLKKSQLSNSNKWDYEFWETPEETFINDDAEFQ